MHDIDPTLMRLREIEARIAFAEFHIGEQRALAARMTACGIPNSVAHGLLRTMEDSLVILNLRRTDMLGGLQQTPTPSPARR